MRLNIKCLNQKRGGHSLRAGFPLYLLTKDVASIPNAKYIAYRQNF